MLFMLNSVVSFNQGWTRRTLETRFGLEPDWKYNNPKQQKQWENWEQHRGWKQAKALTDRRNTLTKTGRIAQP